MLDNNDSRRKVFISNSASNPDFKKSKYYIFYHCLGYLKGSVILYHPSLHDFREKVDKMNLYNFRYETSETRASRKQQEFHDVMREKNDLDEKEPNKQSHLRKRDKVVEVKGSSLTRFQPSNRFARVAQSI